MNSRDPAAALEWARELLRAVRLDLADAERFDMPTLARAKRKQAEELEETVSRLETELGR